MRREEKIQLVVFDWAGTTVDYGSCAPMVVFERVLEEAGIHLTRDEINGPMGMEKKSHIRTLLGLGTASDQWRLRYGRDWTEEDVEHLYERFEEKLYEVVAEYSTPIPGVTETIKKLCAEGIQIGSTTGYTSGMMEKVIPAAKRQGYEPDCVVTPDVTGASRPTPFMMYECMRRLNVYPPVCVVKVGDTLTDIREGKNGGAWSVGVLTGSNLLGLTQEEYETMEPSKLAARKKEAEKKYREAGADLVIDHMTELPRAIKVINEKLKEGIGCEPVF